MKVHVIKRRIPKNGMIDWISVEKVVSSKEKAEELCSNDLELEYEEFEVEFCKGTAEAISFYSNSFMGSQLPQCDWHYGPNGPTCQGGTVQDESCLDCNVYEKGSNPRVEAYRREK